ncbi:hypothetical protein FOA52_004581, partial [Chlamydomonas sp. UWO 241]
DGLYVAIDLFSPSASASDAPASVCALLGSCPKGLVLVVDAGLASLQRLWCLYEVFWAVQHGKGSAYVRVALPGDTPIEGVVSIQGALTAGLDLAKAECARDKDKSHLLSELRRKSGMQRSNALVTEALGSALFSKLRWRSSVWGWAMYAVLNLRGADHLPLNQLIASVLELDEEEQEMRLLQSYDEKSFIKMLEAGGFSHSEALTKFTDADGHVSQEKFGQWCRGQRGSKEEQTKRAAPTHTALLANLASFACYLDRLGMGNFAEHFRGAAADMAADKAAGRAAAREALSAPAPSGGLAAALDDVMERCDRDDQRGAVQVMYRLLLSNGGLLATDTDEASIPPPELSSQSAVGIADTLRLYMEAAHAMLAAHASTHSRHIEYLADTAAELNAFVASNGATGPDVAHQRSLAGNRTLLRQTMQARRSNESILLLNPS